MEGRHAAQCSCRSAPTGEGPPPRQLLPARARGDNAAARADSVGRPKSQPPTAIGRTHKAPAATSKRPDRQTPVYSACMPSLSGGCSRGTHGAPAASSKASTAEWLGSAISSSFSAQDEAEGRVRAAKQSGCGGVGLSEPTRQPHKMGGGSRRGSRVGGRECLCGCVWVCVCVALTISRVLLSLAAVHQRQRLLVLVPGQRPETEREARRLRLDVASHLSSAIWRKFHRGF